MFHRSIKPLENNSFFLFGARGTGKSTYLNSWLPAQGRLLLNLLDPDLASALSRAPDLLREQIDREKPSWVFIDEVQKVPKLLDVVHACCGTGST